MTPLPLQSALIEGLFAEYNNGLYAFIVQRTRNRQAAEDICQDTWLAALSRIDQLRDRSKGREWLFAIAAHRHLDILKSASARLQSPLWDNVPYTSTETMETALSTAEEAEQATTAERTLIRALGRVSDRYRCILMLRDLYHATGIEAGQLLSISPGAADVLRFRARAALRRQYALVTAAHRWASPPMA